MMSEGVRAKSAFMNKNFKRHNRISLGNLSEDTVPQTLTINDNEIKTPAHSSSSRPRSETISSALSNVGFRSIINSSSSPIPMTQSASNANSSTPKNNKNAQAILFPINSKLEQKRKKSIGRLGNGGLMTNNSVSSSSSSYMFNEDDSSSKKSLSNNKSKDRFNRIFGRNKDRYERKNNDGNSSSDAEHIYGKSHNENLSFLEAHHFDDLLSLKDPDYDFLNVSKLLSHGGNNSSLANNNFHSKNTINTGFNTMNLDHLMKQDAMLSEREYHYMYDLLKNLSPLVIHFTNFKSSIRNKILNNLIFIINDINYAVINNDHMLPKTENLNKIILVFIKLSFLNFGMVYDAEIQSNTSENFTKDNSNYYDVNGSRAINKPPYYTENGYMGNAVNQTATTNGKLLRIVSAAETSSMLFDLNMSVDRLEFITKKFNKFIMKFYDKIFKDLVYMIENQLIYENNDEKILNNSIKRLNLIWHNFNSHYMPNIIILNHEFNTFTKTYLEKFNLQNTQSDLKTLLLEVFRDCILMPIYENYDYLTFKEFLMKQDINSSDKLVFLQCLGVIQLGIDKKVEEKNFTVVKMLITALRENMMDGGS
ncbi:hypothetical protein QEN19_003240 [Hanseniaspora menglaensis]